MFYVTYGLFRSSRFHNYEIQLLKTESQETLRKHNESLTYKIKSLLVNYYNNSLIKFNRQIIIN